MAESLYAIALVSLIGAAPLLEIWIAIPIGIAMGLSPLTAVSAGVTGNFIPLIAIALAHHRAQNWFKDRFSPDKTPHRSPSGRYKRFKELWNRYGLPIAALAAPATIGAHLATILALIGGSSRKSTLLWMAASLILWGVTTSIASFYGIELIRSIFW